MRIEIIHTSRRFEKHYRKLSKRIREEAKAKEKLFREDFFNPILRTHKLHGKDDGLWAFWINNSYRIKLIRISTSEVVFLDVGTHDIYT